MKDKQSVSSFGCSSPYAVLARCGCRLKTLSLARKRFETHRDLRAKEVGTTSDRSNAVNIFTINFNN